MKKHFSLFILLFCCLPLFAQSNNNEDEVVKIDRINYGAYREGQVIVKFRPESAVRVRRNAQGKFASASVNRVTDVLNSLGFEEAEELMPLSGNQVAPRKMRTFNGTEIQDKNLSKLYCFRVAKDAQLDVHRAVEQLQALDEVEYAEPNYIVYALSATGDRSIYESEPLYPHQWGPEAIGLPALWDQPKVTTKRPVIAIIDTGVDIEHPDLAANIWTNEKEANGADGEDDDNNGFVDDIHGYDFVNQTGANMADYNGHGTHCAGIAAAVGNNGIGITGANPDALIMPVAVMQSDGTGDIATIIKGIDYATANGADVISMSLGTYSYSLALEQSLGKAYAKAAIVAAAGNDNLCIIEHLCPLNHKFGAPMFPAAFQFVLGVEATDGFGYLAGFSNYDEEDGPYYSTYFSETQLYNYELRAPGVDIVSTFPKGRYRVMNGTSMACPLAAGAISRLLQCKEYPTKELLFGDLINTRKINIDVMSAYQIADNDRRPTLSTVTYYLTDTLGDNDGRADAGDTLAIYPVLRNNWGTAQNIQMWLEMGDDLEDASLITFLDTDKVDFGTPLTSYAKSPSLNPLRLVVSKNCVDGRHIRLMLKATCDNMENMVEQPITLVVENGVEIGGMQTQDLTLYPDVHYIVTSNLVIPKGVTLKIMPGTTLKFKNFTGLAVGNGGHLVAIGKPDSMITFTTADLSSGGQFNGITATAIDTFAYCMFSNLGHEESKFILSGDDTFGKQCTVSHCAFILNEAYNIVNRYVHIRFSTIYSNIGKIGTFDDNGSIENTNICANYRPNGLGKGLSAGLPNLWNKNNIWLNNNVFANTALCPIQGLLGGPLLENINAEGQNGALLIDMPQYWGGNREDIIREGIWDMNHKWTTNLCYYDLSKRLARPSPLAHGIVWKVVVNGYDAQDEFEQLPPLGVGRHKFEVYFNRAMDTIYTPMLTMGVRSPYTQINIAENGSWSADSTIYTAYLNLTGSMATDGLCRIYVADAKDNEHFEIPIENTRFNVQVSAAGSMSTGFMAEAGLGKVNLEWNNQDANIADVLGYNMYRYTMDTLGNCLDTLRLNTELIDDTLYTDFSVTPGTTYYYYYKVLRTDLQENSPSHTVASTPLTASKGDANGSMKVDVADVVTEIAYLTNENPQPFIYEAADVNGDSTINILDVVGTINIIVHTETSSLGFSDDNTAVYTIEDGVLYVETPVVLGGVQFTLAADRENASIQPMEALQGFEQVGTWSDDDTYTFLAYSMSGKTLPVGKHALLRIGDAAVEGVVLSNPRGQNVPAILGSATAISVAEAMQMRTAYPNPFTTEVTIPYIIGQTGTHDVRFVFTNVAGLVIDTHTAQQFFGEYTYTWRPDAALPAGVYFVTLYVDDKALQVAKLIRAVK